MTTQTERDDLIKLLRQGVDICNERGIQQDYARVAAKAADMLEADKRTPLTFESIMHIAADFGEIDNIKDQTKFARAIEAAHGITGGEK